MHEVAEIDLEEIWACAPREALQRIVDVARKVLKAATADISSIDNNQRLLRFESGAQVPGHDLSIAPTASIETPIVLSNERVIGVLSVSDTSERTWSNEDRDLLNELAACLTSQIDLSLASLRRETAEAALEDTRAHLLAVADRVPGLIFERRKTDAGRSAYTFFGTTKSRLPAVRKLMEDGGAGDFNFVHRDDREVVRAAILRSTLEETDLDLTFRVKDFDHTVRWLRSQSIVRRDAEGTVCWDGLIFDISDLMAAREDADAARAEKEKLLQGLDLKMRAPLEAIVSLTEALKTGRHAESTEAHARDLAFASESVLGILNQLIAWGGGHDDLAESPRTSQAERAIAKSPPNAAPSTANNSTGGRILLADDLDLNRKLIADMLSIEGHVVECVGDGSEAVRLAAQGRFDLVLMDMIMPVMDGITATRAIRALPAPACNVPIVALTAHSTREQLDDCLKAGMDATLTKPMSIDALHAAVEVWVGRRTKAA